MKPGRKTICNIKGLAARELVAGEAGGRIQVDNFIK